MSTTNLPRLGKKPAIHDLRTLKLAKYIRKELPPPPDEVSWITKLAAAEPLPMYLNDALGDCVIAGAGHAIQQWNFYAGHPFVPTDADILKGYEDVGGYVPGDPSTDRGAFLLDMLNYWRKVGLGGHKISAFMSVDPTSDWQVRQAIELFGNCYIGLALPISAAGQGSWIVPDGGTSSDNGQPGSWGGHCVLLTASSQLTDTCVTWGTTLKMSHNFRRDYCDEAYAVLSNDWMDSNGFSPSKLDLKSLEQDLAALICRGK